MLKEDRGAVQRSHARGERRKEADELLHLQLLARPLRGSNRPSVAGSRVLCDVLTPSGFVPASAQDLALLAQADVLGGVFASTFVKSALQLGAASAYVSLDTFPWCPLLRCFWHWRDLCHNCEARTGCLPSSFSAGVFSVALPHRAPCLCPPKASLAAADLRHGPRTPRDRSAPTRRAAARRARATATTPPSASAAPWRSSGPCASLSGASWWRPSATRTACRSQTTRSAPPCKRHPLPLPTSTSTSASVTC